MYQYLAAQFLMFIYINFSESMRLAMQMNSDARLHKKILTGKGKLVRRRRRERRDTFTACWAKHCLSFLFILLAPSVRQTKLSSWPSCTLRRAEMMAFCRYESPRAKSVPEQNAYKQGLCSSSASVHPWGVRGRCDTLDIVGYSE